MEEDKACFWSRAQVCVETLGKSAAAKPQSHLLAPLHGDPGVQPTRAARPFSQGAKEVWGVRGVRSLEPRRTVHLLPDCCVGKR